MLALSFAKSISSKNDTYTIFCIKQRKLLKICDMNDVRHWGLSGPLTSMAPPQAKCKCLVFFMYSAVFAFDDYSSPGKIQSVFLTVPQGNYFM